MNRNVFVDNNKKLARRDSRKGSSSRPTEHRLPGQRSIEQEFQVEPASSRTESVDIDWEGIGIPIPEKPGSRRGSDEPEILSDDLLAMEEASRRDSEDASPFHILNLDPYFKPPPTQRSLDKIMEKVTELGIQKQESGDSENTDSGAKHQDCLNSRHQDSELNLCDSGASRQKDSEASSRSVDNSGNSGRRQDSGGHGNHLNRRQDSPRRQDNQGFRSSAPSNGGFSGRRQESENRQDLRQDSPRHQNGSGYRNRSRSPAPSNDGFSRRRQDSGDRQNRRQDSPRRQDGPRFRSRSRSPGEPSRRRQDSEDRHPDHQILLLLKTILPKLLWARAMDLKQIFVCHGHHAIFKFMENPDEMNGMDEISNRLKTILSKLSYLNAIKVRDILEEAGGNDIWRFMKGEPINQGNQERFEDRNRQNQIDHHPRFDRPACRDGQNRSPDRQSQRNYSPDRRDGDDGRYRSPDRQRRDFSPERSPIRNGQYRPDSPDRRSNHSNHDEPKIAKSNGRLMQKAEWSFNWDGARRQLKEMINRRLQYPDFVPFFNDPDVRAACEARGYTNPGLTQTMNRLKNMKRTAPPTRELMCQIRKEEDIRSSNKVCILCCYELWKAAH